MDIRTDLLCRIEAFLAETGMKQSPFGEMACGDPNFVDDLRKGREPRSALRAKVQGFMDAYKIPGSVSAAPVANPTRAAPVSEGARRV